MGWALSRIGGQTAERHYRIASGNNYIIDFLNNETIGGFHLMKGVQGCGHEIA